MSHRPSKRRAYEDPREEIGTTCTLCGTEFEHGAGLLRHAMLDCWATLHAREHPREWTSELISFVQTAVGPGNSKPNWARWRIERKLKIMIDASSRRHKPLEWNSLKIPQKITPEHLCYQKKQRVKKGAQSSGCGPEPLSPSPPSTPLSPSTTSASKQVTSSGCGPEPLSPARSRVSRSLSPPLSPPSPSPIFPRYPATHYKYSSPQTSFKHHDGELFRSHNDPFEILIYIDGTCTMSPSGVAKAGCGVVFSHTTNPRPWYIPKRSYLMNGQLFFRLEDIGPTGESHKPTDYRAKLRTVIAALEFALSSHQLLDSWKPRRKTKLVIATSSSAIANDADEMWLWDFLKSGPMSRRRNQDYDSWVYLLRKLKQLRRTRSSASVHFWTIKQDENEEAARAADFGAKLPNRPEYGLPYGVLSPPEDALRFG